MYKSKLYKEYSDGMRYIRQFLIVESDTIEQLHNKILSARDNGFKIVSVINPQEHYIY